MPQQTYWFIVMEKQFDTSEIEQEIKKVSDGTIESYTTCPLNSRDRHTIHRLVESFGNLCSISSNVLGSVDKIVKITIRYEENDELSPETIKFFSDYSRTPLPAYENDYLEYYLGYLDKYFNCIKMFNLFKRALSEMKIHELKSEASRVRNEVVEYIKKNEEYIAFTKNQITPPVDIMARGHLYHQQHAGLWFVSIDVKSANYRTLKRFCPSVSSTEWKEFIEKFTKVDFLIESKYFREVIFGDLGHRKLLKLPLIFVSEVIQLINSNDSWSSMKKVFCSEDEVVYQVSEDFDIDELDRAIEQSFPGTFRVEKYKMTQIGNLSYFVKEFTSGKLEFKNIPRKFIMQCLKHYEKNDISETDRKFTDECNMVATYDKDIFKNGKQIKITE